MTADAPSSTIWLEVTPPIGRVTFNRPEVLNAGNAAFVRDLTRVVAELHRPDIDSFPAHCI